MTADEAEHKRRVRSWSRRKPSSAWSAVGRPTFSATDPRTIHSRPVITPPTCAKTAATESTSFSRTTTTKSGCSPVNSIAAVKFSDRREAGKRLAESLGHLRESKPLVIGLPRGGVVVAGEVAAALDADLDVLVVRKIGAPSQPELGLGAIAEGGVLLLNKPLMRQVRVTKEQLQGTIDAENVELERRMQRYRGDRQPIDVTGRTVIVIDDGLATGGTARVAAGALRHLGAGSITLAVPVGSKSTVEELATVFDEVVCLSTPPMFFAISQSYDNFGQTSDEEVVAVLAG